MIVLDINDHTSAPALQIGYKNKNKFHLFSDSQTAHDSSDAALDAFNNNLMDGTPDKSTLGKFLESQAWARLVSVAKIYGIADRLGEM